MLITHSQIKCWSECVALELRVASCRVLDLQGHNMPLLSAIIL